MTLIIKLIAGAAAVTLLATGAAFAASIKLPKQMSWTAYGTSSSGYAQSVAIGNMLKNKHGTELNVIPGKNDISRMTPLKKNTADFCACGIAIYFAQEGVKLFANKKWGPQKVRVLMASMGAFGLGLAVAKDTGVTHYKDLKGKRVAWVRASPALTNNALAMLAFGGLTLDDVKPIDVGGFKASVDAVINGQADAVFMSTVTPHAKRLAASPRGIIWPKMDPSDKAGWDRVFKVAPYFQKHTATSGADISKEKPWLGAGYSYPTLVANHDKDATVVYSLVKAMHQGYDGYKDAAPGAKGWKNQNFQWALPFHTAAVKYWKEAGMWNAAAQKHQDGLIKRQNTLVAAWKTFMSGKTPSDKEAFGKAWMKARVAALKAAGMDPVFE